VSLDRFLGLGRCRLLLLAAGFAHLLIRVILRRLRQADQYFLARVVLGGIGFGGVLLPLNSRGLAFQGLVTVLFVLILDGVLFASSLTHCESRGALAGGGFLSVLGRLDRAF